MGPFAAGSLAVHLALASAGQVTLAFEAARRGDFEALSRLKASAADVPAVRPYLRDRSEALRGEAVVVLASIGGIPGCTPLASALVDPSEDVRERSARALHRRCPPATTAGIPHLGELVRSSVRSGNTAAGAVLLLGRSPTTNDRAFLARLVASGARQVKLDPWSQPVPVALAAAVAGASDDVPSARARLARGMGPLVEAEFLALTLSDVRDPFPVRSFSPLLDDVRTVASGTPSGAEPRRRVCDLAAETLATRLGLRPSFELPRSGRYSTEELADLRRLATAPRSSN